MTRVCLFAVLAGSLAAQTPTPRQSISMKTAGGAVISPDARYVAWTVNEADWEENEFKTQIWLWSRDTGQAIQITQHKKGASSPAFSPDSRRLAFLSTRDGKSQVYIMSLAGGEGARLTDDESGVNSFRWSPDGHTIAYTSTGPEPKELKDRKEQYGDFEIVRQDYRYVHLYTVDAPLDIAKPAKGAALTSGSDFSVGSFAWSPDGHAIAFSAPRNPDLSMGSSSDIYVVRLADKSLRKIVDRPGGDQQPVWSPDGQSIAFIASAYQQFDCCANSRLAVIPASGGALRFLANGFDENPSIIAWAPAGVYFSGLRKTRGALYLADAASDSFREIPGSGDMFLGGVTFSRDFRTAAFTAALPNQLSEVYVTAADVLTPRVISDLGAQLKDFRLATREVVSWKSTDGAEIEGVLIKPAGFDPSKKYPLLVVIHGGPTGVDTPAFQPDRYYPIENFVAKGALILRPNYRGSAGYGEKFRSLNVRNLGVGDAWDVLSGVDALVARSFVDPERLGCMGWSQGGYISAFLTTSSNRFKAISVGAGISDWMTYYVNTDITQFTRNYLKATPWDDPEIYRKTSPISYLKTAKTPTLIQHGENDRRVPIPNGYELRQALEDRGVPVRMVVYKGFGHGITKPKQLLHVTEDNLRWFSQYIWGER